MKTLLARTSLLAASLLAVSIPPAAAAPYTLFIYESPGQLALRPGSDTAASAYWASYDRFGKDLAAAGVLRGGSALNTAPISLVASGKSAAATAPYAGSAQALGGYFQIDVPSDADAIAWAMKLPAEGGIIEVRAGYPVPGMKM